MQSLPLSIAAFIFVLGILVFIHEFGHYAVAKLFKVRVEVFSLGFGKRLVGFHRGDTDYRISLLPLGGYVKMAGENPMEARTDDPGEFMNHPRWQRLSGTKSRLSNRR
jgi:regulator of sigma E protease